MMSLLRLPNELLLYLAPFLEYCWNINSFGQVNRRLHTLLNSYLYQHNLSLFGGSVLEWAAAHGRLSVIQKCFDLGVQAALYKNALEKAMRLAAEKGHDTIVKLLLEKESNLSQINLCYLHNTPLLLAAQNCQVSVARLLLEHEANKITRETRERISLPYLTYQGNLSIVELFVEMGWHPDSVDITWYGGSTALMIAVEEGYMEIARYLLQAGADPNFRRPHGPNVGYTPICYAATGGHIQAIHFLIEHGAEVNPVTPDEVTMIPICSAIEEGHMEAADAILKHMEFNHLPTGDNEQAVLLCVAAACGQEVLVQRLLDHGCHPDATQTRSDAPFRREGSFTALTWAAALGHEKIAILLLSHGASINLAHSVQPFKTAILAGNLQIARILLEKGANTNRIDIFRTPIMYQPGVEVKFKFLLEHGIDPAPKHDVIRSLLRKGHIEVLQMLLDRGVELCDSYNHNALRHRSNGFIVEAALGGTATLEFLFKHGRALPPPDSEEGSNAMIGAIFKHDVSAVEFLLSRGFRPIKDDDLPFELTCTSTRGTRESGEAIIKLLLSYGLDINARNSKQRTCLFETIGIELLDLLLENGADPLAQDKRGQTPLSVAARHDQPGDVETLLRFVNTASRDRLRYEVSMAESIAVAEKHWKVVRVLQRFYYLHLAFGG